MGNNWIPAPLFTPEERAALVRLKGEEWVQGEEEFMGHTKAIMDLIDPPKDKKE